MFNGMLKKKKEQTNSITDNAIPKHIAIIMDGNGRWAKKRGLPRSMGHRKGAQVLKGIVEKAQELSVKVLTVYGFSTENWKRPEEEVSLLMSLIKEYLEAHIAELHEKNVQIKFIGYIPKLEPDLQKIIANSEELTAQNTGLVLQLAINYGGRDELLRACSQMVEDAKKGSLEEPFTEEILGSYLDTNPYNDVDLLIRPGDDRRISNFLLWQIAYAELWYTPKSWPEFTPQLLEEAIKAYQKRDRRFGGLSSTAT